LTFIVCSDNLETQMKLMESVRETRSLRWWIGIAIYAMSMLAMAVSVAWVVGVACLALGSLQREGAGILASASLPSLYVALLSFPIAMLVESSRRRALWFAALASLYVIVFLADVSMDMHIPFWPRFMTGGA